MTTLEKIRAEIDGLLNDGFGGMYDHGVFDCLQIIDKHAEQEPQESDEQPLSEELVEHYRKLAEHYDKRTN